MALEKKRLTSLIEFAQQSARMRSKAAANVADHGQFALYEHQIQGLPGFRVSTINGEDEDEVWLVVERLHETKPPEISNGHLRPWVYMTQNPTEEPRLLESTDGANLIAAGTHSSSAATPDNNKPRIDPTASVVLSDYEGAAQVRAQFLSYIDNKWRPWASEEKLRRESIRLYSRLFTLKQQLEGGIVEAQIELVWGVGLTIWNTSGCIVGYPLIGRLVELAINPTTSAVEIRPRDVDARLEIDWYASVDNPGVAALENAAREFFEKATTTFSPFDRGTFEPLLRTAVSNLDANGIYWADEVPAEDRAIPKPDEKLKVTDTWVLFARPRTSNLFLQDLEKLKQLAEETENYPPAVSAVVTDPDITNPVIELPSFRGVSSSYRSEHDTSDKEPGDLYFPKPFNDEQVRIVQLLEVSDGVVVQGPPGTGKTHTIANVICHYLAEGKRVLVTSMKDPALAVLQDQLPDEIRPLAISLLTSEQEGMKQFEHAIHRIASGVQSLDRSSTERTINHLKESINALHGKLARIDYRIGEWAKRNLVKIVLGTEEIDPQDAAREVIESAGEFEWIPDTLGIGAEFESRISDADMVRLRDARRSLGRDIDYLQASLPQIVEFPDSKALLEVHQDLSQFERLIEGIERGDVPALSDSSQETLALAQQLMSRIISLSRIRGEVARANRSWTVAMRERILQRRNGDLLRLLEGLGAELEKAVQVRKAFLERPVVTPSDIELNAEIVEAIGNLAQSRSPFGLKGLFGKSEQKQQLESIRILGNSPADAEDWEHVANHLALLRNLRELALRWNALARELNIEATLGERPEDGQGAAQEYALYVKLKEMVVAEAEVCKLAARVFPSWPHSREVADGLQHLSELEKAVQHHLTKNRLANVWANKAAAIVSIGGSFGGGVAQYHLRQVGVFLDLHFINKPEFMVNAFQPPAKFNSDGDLIDPTTQLRLKEVLLSLKAFTLRLQQGN